MNQKELRRLTRIDLLEMMLELSKENEALRKQLEDANRKLEDRRIVVEEAGSLAVAAFQLNGIFDAAQKTCDQYTENMRLRYEQQQQICREMELETQKKCEQMLAKAKEEAEAYLRESLTKNTP